MMKTFNEWVFMETGDPALSNQLYDQALRLQLGRLSTWMEDNGTEEPYQKQISDKVQEAIKILNDAVPQQPTSPVGSGALAVG